MLATLLIVLISGFLGWRYARTSIDPDWAMFNLWGATGAKYGEGFLDCKSPGIHLWYLLLHKIVRLATNDIDKRIWTVRFLHHFIMGCTALVYFWMTGDEWGAVAFSVLINSGHVLSFHGNVGAPAGAALILAMSAKGPEGAALAFLALAFEPKLILAVIAMVVTKGWWVETGAGLALAGAGVGWLVLYHRDWWEQLWEANIEIPRRMTQNRRMLWWFPWFMKEGLVYFLPAIGLAVISRPDLIYWLPALGYVLVLIPGKVLRPNHLIPLIPWVVGARLQPWMVLLIIAVDWGSAGFYMGNIWRTFYFGLTEDNEESISVGKWLRDKEGSLWVNGYLTQIYIYAGKPPIGGLTEQLEIREVAKERREKWLESYRGKPPTWVVITSSPGYKYEPRGYTLAAQGGLSRIYKRGR